ncbi:MAG: OmpA family protein [Chitinophagaceae bacterium]|nr:OmpA family protein [Chitinophagaceae bacterium]
MPKILLCICFLWFGLSGHAQPFSYVVLFDYDLYEIPDSSMLNLIRLMNSKPIERVLLEGHCDSIGSRQYNYTLSENRANAVKKLLVDNGMDKKAIKTCIGFGKDRPINFNRNEYQRQQNRRVIVTFYPKKPPPPLPPPPPPALVQEKPKQPPAAGETASKAPPPRKIIEVKTVSGQLQKEDFKVGKQLILKNLIFFGGRHVLKPESMPQLENLLNILKENPTLAIEIQGHVCCTTNEPDGYDWDEDSNNLSVTRARMVYEYLIEHGINADRLSYIGYGGSRKINRDEYLEEMRAVNRRVEVRVVRE